MKVLIFIAILVFGYKAESINEVDDILVGDNETFPSLPTRRILGGNEVGETRPYMRKLLVNYNGCLYKYSPLARREQPETICLRDSPVVMLVYLRPASNVEHKLLDSHWLCGGAIIHERYVITSAACIEDAKHFYVISGTHTWIPPEVTDNECINNGAKRAVWKCVPKSYFFDGDDFDNIRWMVGDIAIVEVEDDFNFERRIRGCDFIPKKVDYNNQSQMMEKSATFASIAGWGTTEKFVDTDYTAPLRSSANSVQLLETDVRVISKSSCKKRWDERYHFIINDEMICTKDSTDDERAACVVSLVTVGHATIVAVCPVFEEWLEKRHGALTFRLTQSGDISCKGLELSEEDYYDDNEEAPEAPKRRMIIDPRELQVHTAAHRDARRKDHIKIGGFCENDHGGPLIVGRGKSSVVIGIMSACHTKEIDMKCYGPYLFTSVFKYRHLISCALGKNSMEPVCRRLLSSSNTHVKETAFDWPSYPERQALRTNEEKQIARNFDVPPASHEMPSPPSHETLSPPPRQSPPSPKPPPPPIQRSPPSRKPQLPLKRRITTTRSHPLSTAAPPYLSEQEFRQNAKKEQQKNIAEPAKKIDTSPWLSRLQQKVPTWLTDIHPPHESQSTFKLQTAVSGESDNFSAIKQVIMRRFFNQMHVEK